MRDRIYGDLGEITGQITQEVMCGCLCDDGDTFPRCITQRLRLWIGDLVYQLVLHDFVALAEGKFSAQINRRHQPCGCEMSASLLQSDKQLLIAG